MVDGKKIAGSIFVAVVIFSVGILAYEALTPDYLTKEDVEIAREKCLEKKNYYFSYSSDLNDNIKETFCKFNLNTGKSRIDGEEILLEKIIENQERIIKLLEQKNIGLNYGIESYSENVTNYDITMNQTIDDQNCFYQKDGAVWKFLRCD